MYCIVLMHFLIGSTPRLAFMGGRHCELPSIGSCRCGPCCSHQQLIQYQGRLSMVGIFNHMLKVSPQLDITRYINQSSSESFAHAHTSHGDGEPQATHVKKICYPAPNKALY